MERYVCIHGHFYQPPRENPWLEEVEVQDSAYPYHDWNERISAECYAPNSASRILDAEGRITQIVSNYSKMSFNFGPTLLSWLQKHQPEIYQAILEADRLSVERFGGHGSAMAQVYNHMIMPLANRRDKYTQALWGVKDFERRFKRFPEGMWLSETAVDLETLEVLAEVGIKFTVLAPTQAKRVRQIEKEGEWQDVSGGKIDPTMAYLCPLPSGKTINLFFYDGPISKGIAFEGLLASGEGFAQRLVSAFNDSRGWPQLVHIATDGETYGHHHRFGDMALAYGLHFIESNNLAKITNYGEFLHRFPPTRAVEIFESSSWSCVHGVERWRNHCGCNSGMRPGWNQQWRKPLREAMDGLRDNLVSLYEWQASKYLKKPWEARDRYIEILLDRSLENIEAFFRREAARELAHEEKVRVLKLLEAQRNGMLMYTSCGWFFDEISGIETTQVLQYSARAVQLMEGLLGISLESDYLQALEKAPSNIPEFKNASEVYERFVKPAKIDLLRAGAHYAISSLFREYPETAHIYSYTIRQKGFEKVTAGKQKLAIGKATIYSDITWDEREVSYAVLYLGDHNVNGGIGDAREDSVFSLMQEEIRSAFEKSDVLDSIRLMDKHFGMNNYSLWHLFRDEQRKVIDEILQPTYQEIETAYRQIYENHYPLFNFFHSLDVPLPKPFRMAAEHTIQADLKKVFLNEGGDGERLNQLLEDVKKWSIQIDEAGIEYVFGLWVADQIERLTEESEALPRMERIQKALELVGQILKSPNLWKAQNLYFSLKEDLYGRMLGRAQDGDEFAKQWVEGFRKLGEGLRIRGS
jgi:alpha-amylase/alpha-mannosidase (GH57 family)